MNKGTRADLLPNQKIATDLAIHHDSLVSRSTDKVWVPNVRRFIAVSLALIALSCSPGNSEKAPDGATVDPSSPVESSRVQDPPQGAAFPDDRHATEAGPIFHKGQTLYVAVYSHVYWGPKQTHFNLACTLSIRNVDPTSQITVTAVDYYDTAGAHVRHFVDRPRTLAPLETVDFYIKERDTTGGSGANFIVRWGSPTAVNAPIVEAVMIGVDAGQGISFVCPAREIAE